MVKHCFSYLRGIFLKWCPPIGLVKKILYLIQQVCNVASSSMLVLCYVHLLHAEEASRACQWATCIPLIFSNNLLFESNCSATVPIWIYLHRAIINCFICCSQYACHYHSWPLAPRGWRLSSQKVFDSKCPSRDSIRTVASQLFAKSQRPTRSDCDQVSRQLILKYPFTKDDLGCGYVSFLVIIHALLFGNNYYALHGGAWDGE